MRVGVLVSHPIQYLGPFFRELSGRVDLTVYYAHRQTREGQAKAGFGKPFEWDVDPTAGHDHVWLPNVARHPSVSTFAGCDTPEIARVIAREPFDAFLIYGWNRKSSLQAAIACRRYGVASFCRGDSQLQSPRRWPVRIAKRPVWMGLTRLFRFHLSPGVRNRAYLRHYGVPERRILALPHFVDVTRFRDGATAAEGAAFRASHGIASDAFVLLFSGKLIPRKRVDDAVAAVSGLPGDLKDSTALVVAGDGPMADDLRRQARMSGVRLYLTGFQNQSRMPAAYAAADLLILPSDGSETWGLCVNEAFACGCPALVSDACGCVPELIADDGAGWSYPCGDVAALSRLLETVMRDRDGLTRRGRSARSRAMEFSVERVAELAASRIAESVHRPEAR